MKKLVIIFMVILPSLNSSAQITDSLLHSLETHLPFAWEIIRVPDGFGIMYRDYAKDELQLDLDSTFWSSGDFYTCKDKRALDYLVGSISDSVRYYYGLSPYSPPARPECYVELKNNSLKQRAIQTAKKRKCLEEKYPKNAYIWVEFKLTTDWNQNKVDSAIQSNRILGKIITDSLKSVGPKTYHHHKFYFLDIFDNMHQYPVDNHPYQRHYDQLNREFIQIPYYSSVLSEWIFVSDYKPSFDSSIMLDDELNDYKSLITNLFISLLECK